MIETRIVTDPDFRSEFELAESMRAGFRELQKSGELTALLAGGRTARTYRNWAIAAGIAAGALLLSSALLYRELSASRERLAEASRQADRAAIAATIGTGSIVFERMRSRESVTVLPLPVVATNFTMKFDVGLEPAPTYALLIERLDGSATVRVLEVPTAAAGKDGLVSVILHSALLRPGEYQAWLVPAPGTAAETAVIDYRFRVAD